MGPDFGRGFIGFSEVCAEFVIELLGFLVRGGVVFIWVVFGFLEGLSRF